MSPKEQKSNSLFLKAKEAILEANIDDVTLMVKQNNNLASTHINGQYLADLAIEYRHYQLAEFLLSFHTIYLDKQNYLYYCLIGDYIEQKKNTQAKKVINDYPQILEFDLSQLGDTEKRVQKEKTLFSKAIDARNVKMVEFLIEKKTPTPYYYIIDFLIHVTLNELVFKKIDNSKKAIKDLLEEKLTFQDWQNIHTTLINMQQNNSMYSLDYSSIVIPSIIEAMSVVCEKKKLEESLAMSHTDKNKTILKI